MKAIFVFAAVGLLAASTLAKGGGGRPFGGGGRPFGGGSHGESSSDSDSREDWPNKRCKCETTTCSGNPEGTTVNKQCSGSRVNYKQCVGATCSIQTCSDTQLFNFTTLVCEACATGFHVNAQKTKCVCNRGTTLDRATGACVACPTDATVTDDACYCSTSALDEPNNACKPCPAGSYLVRGDCFCNNVNVKQFWSKADFACKDCPGTWTDVQVGSPRRPKTENVCLCPSGQVLNLYSVTCVTCPTGSNLVTDIRGGRCQCTVATQVYDAKTNACVDRSSLKSFPNGRE